MRLSVAMMVMNEEAMLPDALESVREADEIVVAVDSRSTDATEQIARAFTPLVFPYQWTDDFAAARNGAKTRATGDWILSLDADHRLLSSITEVKAEIAQAESEGRRAIDVQSQEGNWRTILWKNVPAIRWIGEAHESLHDGPHVLRGRQGSLKREVLYSPAHALDPDRYIRILSKQVALNPDHTRNLYYLAREYWYRKDWDNAGKLFQRCVKHSRFAPEKSDAHLYMARILWILKRPDDARAECLNAIAVNANFTEALRFMAEMTDGRNKAAWQRFAMKATGEEVLFVRA